MSITAFTVVHNQPPAEGEVRHLKIHLRLEDAQNYHRWLERAHQSQPSHWGFHIEEIEVDHAPEQRIVWGEEIRQRTVWKLSRHKGQPVGVVRTEKPGGRKGKDFDEHEVSFDSPSNLWYPCDESILPAEKRTLIQKLERRIAELEAENAQLQERLKNISLQVVEAIHFVEQLMTRWRAGEQREN